MERVKWYESKPGQTSSIRIMAMISVIVGSVTVLASVVAMFLGNPSCVAIGGIGAGLASVGEVTKSIQKRSE